MSLSASYWPDAGPEPTPTVELRGLTVRWPHVAAIVFPAPVGCVPKRTENRTRGTSYRGPIAVHAGKAWDPRSTVSLAQRSWENCGGLVGIDFEAASGAILAVAELADCHQADGACCHPWGETSTGVWHWQLENVRPLAEPVPCGGQLGLWRPAADVAERVLAQIVLDGGAP